MSRLNRIKDKIGSLFTFSKSERRAILWFLPLLVVAGVLIAVANRPSFENSFIELADREDESHRDDNTNQRSKHTQYAVADVDSVAVELFYFDPNTVTIQELSRLGFSPRVGAGIIKYRERGKRFEIPEDFATCYGVTMEHYTLLEPYIVIGNEFKVEKFEQGSHSSTIAKERLELKPFDPNQLTAEDFVKIGFSPRQSEVIVNYRENMGGFATIEDFAKCYVVSEKQLKRLLPYMEIASTADSVKLTELSPFESPVELNSADSATLRKVSGIGEVLVQGILEYRQRLGGFVRKEQLAEIKGMTKSNFERICKQIWIDSCEITKIDVNFASHKNMVEGLGNHPYATAKMLRKLLKQRQLKGGWSNLGDLVKQNIVTKEEAERLAPYLLFEEK